VDANLPGSPILKWIKLFEEKMYTSKLFSFAVVGSSMMLLGAAILFVLVNLGFPKELANAVQLFITLQCNFLLSDKYTWNSLNGEKKAAFATRYWQFGMSRLATVALNQILFVFLIGIGMNYLIAYIACILAVMFINFGVSEIIFRKK